jgi:hypothetical protein
MTKKKTEKKEKEETKVDEKTQEFYDKYEALVKETGRVISPEMRYTQQGAYPVLTITNVPEQNSEEKPEQNKKDLVE